MSRIIALLVGFLSINAFCLRPLVYHIHIDVAHPEYANVSVDTAGESAFTFLPPRFFNNGEQQAVLSCEKADGKRLPIAWHEPVVCDRVTWRVIFTQVTSDGLNASAQQNTFSPSQGWHLLTEWNVLPRMKGQDNVRVCLQGKAQQCRDLPSVMDAPLLMIDGMQKRVLKVGEFTLNLLYSDYQIIEQQFIWLPVFIHQFRYLQAQFTVEKIFPWDLAWFKRERESGHLGGAAGHLCFLANYPVEKGRISPNAYAYLLKISAHEFVHHLFYVPHALWINESLAEYYAIASLKNTRFDVSGAVNRWRLSAASSPLSYVGLLQAAYNVEKENNYAYYGLFYTKGAAFWGAIDEALQQRGECLSHYLYLLHDANNQALPNAFDDAMVSVIGVKAWVAIKKRYL